MNVNRSGYYAWQANPESKRQRQDTKLLGLIKQRAEELKREGLRRRVFETRNQAREEIFDYIEVFYNRQCRHSFTNGMSSVNFENHFFTRPTSV
jgi:hypothetical protein